MTVHQNTNSWPSFINAVLTIGTFDGVHEGHRKILTLLKKRADEINGETVIVTFHPHPRNIVRSESGDIRLITTIEERIELIERENIDHLIIIPFTEEFSQLTAEKYIEDFLIARFHPRTLIIGFDHRYGKNRIGDYKLMETYRDKGAFELMEIPAHLIEDIKVSSTRIRTCLLEGDIAETNKLLGYSFYFSGTVIHGNKLGRELGYPTANIEIAEKDKIIPADGIYAVSAIIPDEMNQILYKGMMSIGLRPTINGKDRVIEVNLFDFDKDIYGKKIKVFIHAWLRKELKFDSLEALTEQMHRDKSASLKQLEFVH